MRAVTWHLSNITGTSTAAQPFCAKSTMQEASITSLTAFFAFPAPCKNPGQDEYCRWHSEQCTASFSCSFSCSLTHPPVSVCFQRSNLKIKCYLLKRSLGSLTPLRDLLSQARLCTFRCMRPNTSDTMMPKSEARSCLHMCFPCIL